MPLGPGAALHPGPSPRPSEQFPPADGTPKRGAACQPNAQHEQRPSWGWWKPTRPARGAPAVSVAPAVRVDRAATARRGGAALAALLALPQRVGAVRGGAGSRLEDGATLGGSVAADAGEAARAAEPAPGGLSAAPPTATRAGGVLRTGYDAVCAPIEAICRSHRPPFWLDSDRSWMKMESSEAPPQAAKTLLPRHTRVQPTTGRRPALCLASTAR